MHPKEVKRTRNGTGRLTHLALNNSEIIMGVDFSEDIRVQTLLADPDFYPCILYPGKTSLEPMKFLAETSALKTQTPLVFVIDGTWTAAKKMMRLSQNLHSLPRLALAPNQPSQFVIKHQPNPLCLSTVESVAVLLKEMENQGLENIQGHHKSLLDILERVVQTQLDYINDPTAPGYRKDRDSPPTLRARSKKHRKRFPFFG